MNAENNDPNRQACPESSSALLERSKALHAVDVEKELTDEMPDELWQACQTKEGATMVMRYAVVTTKRNIRVRIAAVNVSAQSGLLGQMVYILIEHGDPARIHICATEQDRQRKTAAAIFGDEVNADLHPTELESDLAVLAEDRILTFEGEPPLEWVDGYLA